ncbi:hypothetical protein EXIGLDRAFT_841822 [Exidia glandulosa HHB12029]|uniref:Blue (type 1) copper domain-containing protein n=1 Tax=Exidia glandulosa HHB12029 TaxID=1314781 RepID=A0A165DMJ6_EXIGL|nr:hypothetical protein EXIGLDRAFT_841822 [Exidia glandulosa HHB12029]
MRSQLFVAASLSLLAVAQQTVQVGKDGFTFTPNTITGKAGETITFNIVDPIHNVMQAASISTPCKPAGFTNGGASTYSVTLNNTDPVYVYCGPHCTLGMVMIINPKAAGDVDTFAATASGKPPAASGSGTPAASGSGTPAASGSGTPAASGSGSGAAPTTTDAGGSGSSIAPSLVGSIGGLVLAALL